MQLKYVPDWSVIRLQDGRMAVKGVGGYRRGKRSVLFDGETGAELSIYEEVDIVAYASECAFSFLANLQED